MKKFFDRLVRLEFLKNKPLVKIICLILAILAWFFVMDSLEVSVTNTFQDMPVEILGIEQIENQNLIVGKIENAEVDVSLTGTLRKILSMSEKDISLTAALNATTKGTVAVPIEVRLSDSTVQVDISQKIMRVEIDAIETELRPVQARLIGDPPEGIVIGELTQKQSEVSVRGPSNLVKTIAYVDAVGEIGSNDTSFTSFMQLTPRNDKDEVVEGVEVVESFLEVQVPFITTREVPVELHFNESFGSKFKLVDHSYSPEKITIKGEKKIIDAIDSILSREYTLAASNPVEEKLVLLFPEGVTSDVEHVTAQFDVQPIESRTFNFRVAQVTILNASDEYDYEFENKTATIQVEISDSREVLGLIKDEDIKLSIDVNNLLPGTWTTPIKLEGYPAGSAAKANPNGVPIVISLKTKDGE